MVTSVKKYSWITAIIVSVAKILVSTFAPDLVPLSEALNPIILGAVGIGASAKLVEKGKK